MSHVSIRRTSPLSVASRILQEGGCVLERVVSKRAGTRYVTSTKSSPSIRTIYVSATNGTVAHRYTTSGHTAKRTNANVSTYKVSPIWPAPSR